VILLVDAGNSRIKWRLLARARSQAQGTLPTSACDTLARHWAGLRADAAVVCSVAGESVDTALRQALWVPLQRTGVEHWLVSPAQGHGLRSHYQPSGTLGPDRFASLVAAHRLRAVDWLVVTVGTALTADMLTAAGEFLGGAIAPGPHLLRASLAGGTAGIQVAETLAPWEAMAPGSAPETWPRDTPSAVAQGMALALRGVVEGMSRRMALAQGQPPAVLLSGGARGVLRPWLDPEITEVDQLVLEGLACIARDLGYAA